MDSKTKHNRFYLFLFLFITAALYKKAVFYGFYYDDHHIFDNPYVYSFSTLSKLLKTNRPLAAFIWFVISRPFGIIPEAFHLLAIVLHISCGLLIYTLVKEISKHISLRNIPCLPAPPLIVLAVFLLHPIQTESVIYSFQSMTVLPASVFITLTAIFYIRYRSTLKPVYILYIMLCTFLASTARESAIVTPAFLFLIEWLIISKGALKVSLSRWPVYAASLLISGITIMICMSFADYKKAGMGINYDLIAPLSYATTELAVLVRYILLFFFPIGQNLDYDFPIYSNLFSTIPFVCLIIILTTLGSALYYYRKRPLYSFGIFWFFLFLSPTSTFIPINDVIFEHRLYLAMAGLLISSCSICYGAEGTEGSSQNNGKVIFNILFTSLLFSLCINTYLRIGVWETKYSLWHDVIKKSPDKSRPNNNFGLALYNRGRYKEAIPYIKKALKFNPSFADGFNNLGLIYAGLKDYDKAISYYSKAIDINPNHMRALNNLALSLYELGRLDEAEQYLKTALKLNPKYADGRYNLGNLYVRKGEGKMAVSSYMEAIDINPRHEKAHNNLGNILADMGYAGRAIKHLKIAIKLKPDFVDAINNMGITLAQQGRLAEAVSFFQKAVKIDPEFTDARNNLAFALGRQGRFKEAVYHFYESLKIKPDDPKTHNNLGIVLLRGGDRKGAIKHFSEALRLSPDYVSARKNLEFALNPNPSP